MNDNTDRNDDRKDGRVPTTGDDVDAAAVDVKSDHPGTKDPDRQAIPDELPVLPLRSSVVFPGTVMPIKIVREKVHRVLDSALAGSRIVCAVPQRRADVEDPSLEDLYRVGTACAVLKLIRLEDGSETIIVHGITRIGLVEITQNTPFLSARVQPRDDTYERTTELDALVHLVRETAQRVIELSPEVPDEAASVVTGISEPGALADFLAANLSLELIDKQELLETFDVRDRLVKVSEVMSRQVEVLELSQQIHSQVREQMSDTQREYYLREQLKAIQQELGQSDARSSETEKFRERIAAAKMPEEVEVEAIRAVERLEIIPQASPEYGTAVDYLEWMCSLPWSVSTKDRLNIKRAAKILNDDHYGLQKVKKRILEFLAVRQLKPDGRGPILCFAGPPGVGKTSLGQSVARALDRKFARISLGGAHDEADIRGHRRTYIGALPGRIIQELRKAGANNPVFMLDEVDKLGQDFRGDPASALLEVLDPAQNATFVDHYLDVPFNLSGVLFIATANYMDAIPGPLRDRMEVINLPGYTYREKLQIAKKYLVPRQITENGLKATQLKFSNEVLSRVITDYTYEAGVRDLERKIGAICRARAAAIVSKKRRSSTVTKRSLVRDLGLPRYESEIADSEAVPGVVTGLAFTPVGGEILFVEAALMPGNGQLNLTGQIGGVMRESAQAAFSIARNRAPEWGIDQDTMRKNDFHIHVPAGAIPKDGPSAGVAMITALASLLTGRAVEPTTGMTGEITLRGKILPIGGLREKVLAAHRAGLTRVVLPARNVRDLEEIPADIRKQIEFVPVKTIDQLISTVLPKPRKAARRKTKRTRKSPKVA
jgi:ATP-dependent Lon protease